MTNDTKIKRALEIAMMYGTIDGAHHKMWVIDQMVRCLTGCSFEEKILIDYKGRSYIGQVLGTSSDYERFIRDVKLGEDGPETYAWDEGVTP